MNNIVSYLEIIKIMNLGSFVFLLCFFLLFLTKYIAFTNEHIFKQRILKASKNITIHYHYFTGYQFFVHIFTIDCHNVTLTDIIHKSLCPCSRRSEKHYSVASLFIKFQILNKILKLILIRSYRLGSNICPVISLQHHISTVQRRYLQHSYIPYISARLLIWKQYFCLARQKIPFFNPVSHTISKFQFNRLGMFCDMHWFI